jgi:GTPase SAR1 family protein
MCALSKNHPNYPIYQKSEATCLISHSTFVNFSLHSRHLDSIVRVVCGRVCIFRYPLFPVEKLSGAGGRSTLTLWDLGGEAGFRSVWERYFREAHIVVFVLDATARARLPEARAELGMCARRSE